MKIIIKILAIVSTFLVVTHLVVSFTLGGINYIETIHTKYHTNDKFQIIETSHFEMHTPKNWIHVFNTYGEEGEAVGSFITGSGLIRYEYGILSNPFRIDSIFVFSRDSLTIDNYRIYFGYDENNATGIHIPRQNEMEWSFSFFMSESCTSNRDDIINGIASLKFKRFYNTTWQIE